jgi:hypothetical protein
MLVCPRCKKSHFNTFIVSRSKFKDKMPINKCMICGFLWIEDEDLINLSKAEAKKLFVDTLMKLGKDQNGANTT